MPHPFETTKGFKRRFEKKPQNQQVGVLKCIQQVAEDPQGMKGLRTKKLAVVGPHEVFYARIDGGHRLTFHREGSTIVFRNHCNHDAVLRHP